MNTKKSDKRSDILKVIDRGENLSMMEPSLISEGSVHRKKLTDLALELVAESTGFRRSLPLAMQTSLATTVRAMNCYYSNLIEGHDTHPIEIERALQGEYSTDIKKRNLQKEAKAHVLVQEWIDNGGIKNSTFSSDAICEIHQRFCRLLPDELLWVEDIGSTKKMQVVPGEPRLFDVKVGRHIPVSPGAVPRFLDSSIALSRNTVR